MQNQRLGSTFCRGLPPNSVPGSLIDPHGLGSALVGKHLLLTSPRFGGAFSAPRCRHSNQPPAARLKGWVSRPALASAPGWQPWRRTKKPRFGGFFCRGPRAWRN